MKRGVYHWLLACSLTLTLTLPMQSCGGEEEVTPSTKDNASTGNGNQANGSHPNADEEKVIVKGDSIDLGLSVRWSSLNIGATVPEEYGDYFAWGETSPKTSYSWATYLTDLGAKINGETDCGSADDALGGFVYPTPNSISRTEHDAATKIWGENWRMPTLNEINELLDPKKCSCEWIVKKGVYGCRFTSLSNGNSIFLPAAGFKHENTLRDAGTFGLYWIATPHETIPSLAYSLFVGGDMIEYGMFHRYAGRTIRAVYDPKKNH